MDEQRTLEIYLLSGAKLGGNLAHPPTISSSDKPTRVSFHFQ